MYKRQRVLRPDGQVLLVWNDWREVANPINVAYGEVVRTFLTPGNEHVETRVPDAVSYTHLTLPTSDLV